MPLTPEQEEARELALAWERDAVARDKAAREEADRLAAEREARENRKG